METERNEDEEVEWRLGRTNLLLLQTMKCVTHAPHCVSAERILQYAF
jgi:hypothetical protein